MHLDKQEREWKILLEKEGNENNKRLTLEFFLFFYLIFFIFSGNSPFTDSLIHFVFPFIGTCSLSCTCCTQ